MRLWYNKYKNPNDWKLEFFAAELNKGHVRQERPKITVNKLKIWWKNERQREKRISMMEDSKEKEEEEIENLKVEARKTRSRRKFLDQDKEMVKVAKVVPSPQRSLETRSASSETRPRTLSDPHQSQPVPGPSDQASSVQQPMTVSGETQMGSPRLQLTPSIIVVDRPSPAPRGFVSLLQQSPRLGLASSGPVARINPTSPATGLATTGPGTRIDNENVQIWSGADGSEIRSCDIRPRQIGHELQSISNVRPEASNTFEGRSPEVSDRSLRLPTSVGQTAQFPVLDSYGQWNYEPQ